MADPFDVGMVILLIGTILNIIEVLENKKTLAGYNPFGSLIIFLANVCFLGGFLYMAFWTSFAIGIIITSYWGVVCYYLFKEGFIEDAKKGLQQKLEISSQIK